MFSTGFSVVTTIKWLFLIGFFFFFSFSEECEWEFLDWKYLFNYPKHLRVQPGEQLSCQTGGRAVMGPGHT